MAEGNNGGYVKLYRKLLDSEERWSATSLGVWTYLLLEANWRDVQRLDGSIVPRGSLRLAVSVACKELGLTRRQLRRVLERFAECSMIVTKGANKYTLISICNYDTYQSLANGDVANKGPTKGQQRANQGPLSEEGKKGRREEEESISKEIPTGYGPLFRCRDVNPTYLTEFEYRTIKATVGTDTDAHLMHWSAQSAKPKHPWLCARRNLAENLIEKWHEKQEGTSRLRKPAIATPLLPITDGSDGNADTNPF